VPPQTLRGAIMSGKKHSTTAKTPDTKNGNVLVEGEREVLALPPVGHRPGLRQPR